MRTILVLLAGSVACFAQAADWMAMGKGGSVRSRDGHMLFAYDLQPGRMSMAVRRAPGDLAGMQRLRFRVKASADMPVALLLSERKPDGANYSAIFWAPANAWQEVELTPADFSVSDGRNDPPDPDGKLDLDQVEGMGVFDLAQFFLNQPDNPEAPVAIDRPTGSRTLELDGLEVVRGAPAAVRRSIDDFDRGFIPWITTGGMKLRLAPKPNPLDLPALEATASAAGGRFGLLVRRVASLDLARAARLTFDVASENETTLVVSLETKSGKRFNQTVYPPGKREVFHVSLKLADFEGDGEFDPVQWKSLAIADASGEPNTLWLAHVAVE